MIQINPNRKIENNFPDSSIKTATDKFNTLDGGLVNSLTVDMTPVQDLHGYSKPWAGGAGKQKLDYSAVVGTNNDVTFSIASDGGIALSGTASSDVWQSANSNFTLTPGTTYSVNGLTATVRMRIREFDANNVTLNELTVNNIESSFTVNANTVKLDAYIRIASGVATSVEIYPMIRLASVADPTFEPYSNICPISGHTQVQSKINNTTYTTSLGSTYYGGEVEQVSGVGEATLGYIDLGLLTYSYDAVSRRFTGFITGIKNTTVRTMKIVSDIYETISDGQAYDSNWDNVIYNSGNTIIIHNHAYTDPATFKSAMSGHYITYDLATPTTLTLTGQNITAEVGENNVSAPLDGQEIQTDGVTYKEMFSWADVVAYVQSQVNP